MLARRTVLQAAAVLSVAPAMAVARVYSVERGDRGTVYLNGAPIAQVFECSEDMGYLIRFKTDANGVPMLTPDKTEAQTERLQGRVRFEPA
jgi:hypothetical protein